MEKFIYLIWTNCFSNVNAIFYLIVVVIRAVLSVVLMVLESIHFIFSLKEDESIDCDVESDIITH
jgi:hypothetical protein